MKRKGLMLSVVLVCLVVVFSFLSEVDAKILNKGRGSGSVPAFIMVGACYEFCFNSSGDCLYDDEFLKILQFDTAGWVNLGYPSSYTNEYFSVGWYNIVRFENITEYSCY